MANFQKAHQFYTQAVISLANPFSEVFATVRNSSVNDIKSLQESSKSNQLETLKKTNTTVNNIRTMLSLIKESHEHLTNCRTQIEAMLNKTHAQTIEQHAAGLFQESDESEEGSGSNDWSDEVIIS